MKVLIYIGYLLSAFLFLELALQSTMLFQNNILNSNTEFHENLKLKNIYFIGDSYAKTDYTEKSFPFFLKNYCDSINYGFCDLTRDGAEFPATDSLVLSVLNKNNKNNIILLFFNLGDLSNMRSKIVIDTTIESQNKSINNKFTCKQLMLRDYIKDVGQQVSFNILGMPLKGSNLYYNFNYDIDYCNNLLVRQLNLYNSFGNKILLVVTYPLNYPVIAFKNSNFYKFFAKLNYQNIEVVQVVDIFESNNTQVKSLSWRNGHPNDFAIAYEFNVIKLKLNKYNMFN